MQSKFIEKIFLCLISLESRCEKQLSSENKMSFEDLFELQTILEDARMAVGRLVNTDKVEVDEEEEDDDYDLPY